MADQSASAETTPAAWFRSWAWYEHMMLGAVLAIVTILLANGGAALWMTPH